MLVEACVANVKNSSSLFSSKNLLNIRASVPFSKIIKKINHNKKADVILVERAKPSQMTGVLLARLLGKKFIWVQSFSNPPVPSFYTKMILNQADIILVTSKKMAAKLHSFGVDKPKIRIKK